MAVRIIEVGRGHTGLAGVRAVRRATTGPAARAMRRIATRGSHAPQVNCYDCRMTLYTRRGDAGTTDLFGGQRIDKDALRVEAYGTVDELNAALGFAAAACDTAPLTDLRTVLRELQSRLFEIGAHLATPTKEGETGEAGGVPRIGQSQIDEMEQFIDRFCQGVPEMRHFILPGGTEPAARLHQARTICRRAERVCVALNHQESVGEHINIYLNRLSDLLFAMARKANHLAGIRDVPWNPRGDA